MHVCHDKAILQYGNQNAPVLLCCKVKMAVKTVYNNVSVYCYHFRNPALISSGLMSV